MADARKDKRTLLSLKIRYKSATLEEFIERYSNDISRGGIFIKAKQPVPVGKLLKFEFMLQDQSTLIHGVGRVVWRRDESESSPENPSGMGIKFIKMDPESRALVQRIAEGRQSPGVFEQGKEGSAAARVLPSEPEGLVEEDRTKVRHVSEFLASAFEEGGAGEAATREAQAGAERARQLSDDIGEDRAAAARGALSGHHEPAPSQRRGVSEAVSRSASTAFGNSNMGRVVAPPIEELDAEEDFLDHEPTRIQDFPDAVATVVARPGMTPFAEEKRATPVVPASRSALRKSEMPDLFGPEVVESFRPRRGPSLEPAEGEFLDPSLLDPAVPTVPPRAAAVPEAPGIPVEAFEAPAAPAPVGAAELSAGRSSRGSRRVLFLIFVLLVGGVGVAGWRFGVMDLAAPYLGDRSGFEAEPVAVAEPVAPEPIEEVDEVFDEEEAALAEANAPEPVVEEPAGQEETSEAGLAKLSIQSRPTGAFVSVNGRGAGRTPLEVELEPGTKVALFAKARGYLPRRMKVTVQRDGAPVKLVLARLPYVVEVASDPPGGRASSVGGGQITTPGELRFKSMPSSRGIVVSMDGYQTASKTVNRSDFVEEPRRWVASVTVTLKKDAGAEESAPDTAASEDAEPEPSDEVEAQDEPSAPAEPQEAEEPPTPSETVPADAF